MSRANQKGDGKSKTPSYICTLELKVSKSVARLLEERFEMATVFYNDLLIESRQRLKIFKADPRVVQANKDLSAWHRGHKKALKAHLKHNPKARELPSKVDADWQRKKKEIVAAYSEVRSELGFSDYALQDLALLHRKSGFEGLDSLTAQKLATRAYQACERVIKLDAGMPRIKGRNQILGSVEGKSNASGIMFKADRGVVVWGGIEMKVLYKDNDPYHLDAFQQRCKYVRILRRRVKGKIRYAAQLVLEGTPLQKRWEGKAYGVKVGADVGPSTIALVGEGEARLIYLGQGLRDSSDELRREQRHLDRQRRANNQQNYNQDGTIRKGIKLEWKDSKGYLKTRARVAELHRRSAATRKTMHGYLTNQILEMGTVIHMERVSVKGWQRVFGKSISKHAPGMLMRELERKAESAGGQVIWIDTWKAKLSQTCVCGNVSKKALSQRIHECPVCGVRAQRDLFSAYLARYTDGEGVTELNQACEEYVAAGVETLLGSAWGTYEGTGKATNHQAGIGDGRLMGLTETGDSRWGTDTSEWSRSAQNLRAIIRGRGNLEPDDGGLPGGSYGSVLPRSSDLG